MPLGVTVTDAFGNVVPNQLVTFTAPASGASAVLSSSTATTNDLGIASITASANAISGAYAVGVTFGPPIAGGGDNADVFLLTNGTGLATLVASKGTPQFTFIGQLFQTNLEATLLDGLGSPIVGATVYFTSGSVNGAAALVPASAVTNPSGVASVQANAPGNANPGTFPVTATAGGLSATFLLTEKAPQPVVVTITGGSPQTTAIGTTFSTPLGVHVADGFGAARPGVVVTYIPPGSGASATLSAGTTSTDGAGNASLNATANNTLGKYSVTASVNGVTVDFVLTNGTPGSGAPGSIMATAGNPQSQFVHQAFTTAFKVLVKDTSGNPLSGASVTFSAPASGASGTFTGSATVTTNGSGIATAPAFTANSMAGSYLLTAAAGTVSTTFNLMNLGGAPASMKIFSGNNQSATINTAFATPLAVQLFDKDGNASGANWSGSFIIAAGASGATGTFSGSANVVTDSNGVGTAPTLTANGTAGAFSVFAFFNNFTLTQTFSLTNTTKTTLSNATIAKVFSPTSIVSRGSSTVTLTLSNSNASPLTGGAFTDSLVHMSATGGSVGGTCVGTTPSTLTAGATSLSFTGITIPANGNCTVTFSVTSNTADINPNSTSGVTTAQTPIGAASNIANLTVTKATPMVTWANPANLGFGSALGSLQLNATANVPGTFVYTPPAGTVLLPGANQKLSVTFTPADTGNYNVAGGAALLNINPVPTSGPPQFVVTSVLSRDPITGNIVVLATFANAGGSLAENVQLTAAYFGTNNLPITVLPASLGDIATGKLAQFTLQFSGSVGAPGFPTTLTLSGTYTGAGFVSRSRIQLP
jgi:hypothetical protein